ncbi:MAG: dTMP kinase [Thermomicrobiales bacterium]
MLAPLIEAWNAAGIRYCILHGYEGYPERVPSDVDCLMPAAMLPRRLATTFQPNGSSAKSAVVQWLQHEATAHYFIVAHKESGRPWSFLPIDASSDYRRNGRVFYRGDEILATRRRSGSFWIPSPAVEFGYYLAKKLAKGSLTTAHGGRLSELYRHDPSGCDREIVRLLGHNRGRLVIAAASSGRWDEVQRSLAMLRAHLLRQAAVRRPLETAGYWVTNLARLAARVVRPTGLLVAILGADGSGKSTVIAAVQRDLAPAFRRTDRRHFAPALFRGASSTTPVSDPHGLPPRSWPASIAKTLYWLFDYTVGYHLILRPALVRSTFVLFDRYLLDALVDPKRYRFAAPSWWLRLVWAIVPKPDLVILLDAPPEVLQNRKREVPFAESARQRDSYRQLVQTMPNGRIVDAAQPLDRVVADVNDTIVEFLAARTADRLGLEARP